MTSMADQRAREPSDAELIRKTRDGDPDAYGTLFARHSGAATMLASRLTAGTPVAADDVVADAFLGVLSAIRSGNGPEESFRPYLYAAVRNGAATLRERESRVLAVEDPAVYEKPAPTPDPVVTAFESDVVQRAFASLPERWQAVLWYHEVEAMKPAAIAPLLGISPNGVSALLLRAREGLRESYVVAHLGALGDARPECRWAAERLGAHVRGSLSHRDRRKVVAHLADCADCSAMAAEAAEVDRGLYLVIAPLILGGSGAAWLASQRTPGAESAAAQSAAVAAPRAAVAAPTAASRVGIGGVVAVVTSGIVVVAMVALAVAGVLTRDSGGAAPGGIETPAPDLQPETSEPQDQGTPEGSPEPVTDDGASPAPPADQPVLPPDPIRTDDPPASGPEEPGDSPTLLAQSIITGVVTVIDRDHPTLALSGPVEAASVTWISDQEIAADTIFFEMPTGEYALDADEIEVQSLPDGSVRYVSTADAAAIVSAFNNSDWAVDETFGVVDWRIQIVENGSDAGGVRLDGPLEFAGGQQLAIDLIASGSGTAYITTLNGLAPESSVVDGVLWMHALEPTVVQRVIVVFGP